MKNLYHCTFELSYHFVFITKFRRKILTSEMLVFLEDNLRRLCEKWGGRLVEFNGERDHATGAPRIRLMEAGQGRAKPERSDALMRWNRAYAKGWLMARQFWAINHAELRLPSRPVCA